MVDECVKKIVDTTLGKNGYVLIVADHGNADQMQQDDGSPHTAHTMAKVPAILVGYPKKRLKARGTLADVAPTILELLEIEKPEQMTGKSLVK